MQFALLLSLLAVYGQLACAVREKRQVPACEDISSIPESCRLLLESSLRDRAYADPTAFIETYCNDTCAQPLYDYFRECDKTTGSTNATTFDFFCSRVVSGHGHCLPAIVADTSFVDACSSLDSGFCDDQCKTALLTARHPLGCCLDSYYAVVFGPTAAARAVWLCGLTGPEFCTGGVTEEPLKFFVVPEVDSRCEDLVDDVPEDCRYLISPTFSIRDDAGFGNLHTLCDDLRCSPYVYDFTVGCDDRTGQYNSKFLDFYCATKDDIKRCGDVIHASFAGDNPLEPCYSIEATCPSTCSSALAQAQTDLGCCLNTYIQLVRELPDANSLLSLCGLEGGTTCGGFFGGGYIDPPSEYCKLQQQMLPLQCLGDVSLDTLTSQATADPDTFRTNFCNSECGEAVYNYHFWCDRIRGSDDAAKVDFLCAQNDGGTTCAGIFLDSSLETVLSCADVSNTICSDQCSTVLQEPSHTWGCCLFTLTALADNIMHSGGIFEQCKLPEDQAHVCDGAFSGEPVAAPGVETTCDMLARAIPDRCNQYLSDNTLTPLMTLTFSNPDEFLSGFCESECAKPIYEYLSKCYILEGDEETAAVELDLFCSEDRGGSDCVRMLFDDKFQRRVDECGDLEKAPGCFLECSPFFEELSNDWGCCFYSYSSLESNVTYSDQVWGQCEVSNPGLCRGAISGRTIGTTGSDGVAATVVSSLMPVIALLTLTLAL